MTNPLFKKRQSRTRHRIATHGTRPRLSVFRSGKHIYAQVIDDTQAVTVASASTNEKDAKCKGYCHPHYCKMRWAAGVRAPSVNSEAHRERHLRHR